MALAWTDMGRGGLASVRWDVRAGKSGTAAAVDSIEIARGAICFSYKGGADIPGAAGVRQGIFSMIAREIPSLRQLRAFGTAAKSGWCARQVGNAASHVP
jgi:hypothetical protein